MARPRKVEGERRTARLPGLRLTPAEQSFVEAQARAAGLSVAEYQRRVLTGHQVRAARPRLEDRYLSQLNRVGGNVHQIVRALNFRQGIPNDIAETMRELRVLIEKIGRRYDA